MSIFYFNILIQYSLKEMLPSISNLANFKNASCLLFTKYKKCWSLGQNLNNFRQSNLKFHKPIATVNHMTAVKEDMIYTTGAKPFWSQIFKIKVYLWFFGCFDLKSSLYTLLLVKVVFHTFWFFGREQYRGSLHFVISQFIIPSISWFCFRPHFCEFPTISWFWKQKIWKTKKISEKCSEFFFHIEIFLDSFLFVYCTRATISRGLYIFYPIFHCDLYCRAVSNLCTKKRKFFNFWA